MKIFRAIRACAIFAAVLVMAGCQTQQLTVPAPSFAPPVVRADPVRLPLAGPVATEVASDVVIKSQPVIAKVAPEELINAAALKPKVRARPWKYIIVHHSDTVAGSAARFHKAHVSRGWDSLGYDFVIGNGTETKDGMIEVGPRWAAQLPGAHTGTPDHLYNDFGIGICLVGNFEESRPTAAQMDSLARLCAHMMKTYNIPASRIIGHGDAKSTSCPGRNLSVSKVRALAQQYLAKHP